jgi:hypothetical protein
MEVNNAERVKLIKFLKPKEVKKPDPKPSDGTNLPSTFPITPSNNLACSNNTGIQTKGA